MGTRAERLRFTAGSRVGSLLYLPAMLGVWPPAFTQLLQSLCLRAERLGVFAGDLCWLTLRSGVGTDGSRTSGKESGKSSELGALGEEAKNLGRGQKWSLAAQEKGLPPGHLGERDIGT